MLLDDLLSRRLVVLTGKGGVGKSVVGAALALAARERGKRVLLVEVAAPARGGAAASAARRRGAARPRRCPASSRVNLDPAAVMDEYVRHVVKLELLARRILASPIYHRFFAAAPGLKELMVLGKIMVLEEASKPPRRASRCTTSSSWTRRPPATASRSSRSRSPPRRPCPWARSATTPAASSPCSATPSRTALVVVAIPEEMAVVEAVAVPPPGRGRGRRSQPRPSCSTPATSAASPTRTRRRCCASRAEGAGGDLEPGVPLAGGAARGAAPDPAPQADALLPRRACGAASTRRSSRCRSSSARRWGSRTCGSLAGSSRPPDGPAPLARRGARAGARHEAHPGGLRLGRRRQDDDGGGARPARGAAPAGACSSARSTPRGASPRASACSQLSGKPRAIDLARLAPPPARGGALCAMVLDVKSTFDALVARHTPDDAARDADPREPLLPAGLAPRSPAATSTWRWRSCWSSRADERFDLVVLDTPPTRHALDFLEAPDRLLDFLDTSILRCFLRPYFVAGRLTLQGRDAHRAPSPSAGRPLPRACSSCRTSPSSSWPSRACTMASRSAPRRCTRCCASRHSGFVLVAGPQPRARSRKRSTSTGGSRRSG